MGFKDCLGITAAAGGTAICIALGIGFAVAVDIAALVIGLQNEDAQDCAVDSISLDLSQWLMIGGAYHLAAMGLIGLGVLIAAALGSDSFKNTCICAQSCLGIFAAISWWVVGVIIIAGAPDECKEENRAVWDMTVAYLVFLGIRWCCNGYAVLETSQ